MLSPSSPTMIHAMYHRLIAIKLLLIIHSLIGSSHAFTQEGGCIFPDRWQGLWFQSGVLQPISIRESHLSSKGRCVNAEGDKFLLLDEKGCYRCVVIHEKHANVLQYKETYCHRKESIQHLCQMITGDALLFSMFREDPTPVPCPLRGPFTFTYSRGHGPECKNPVSNIDSCTEESRLILSYQACHDIDGIESTVEELQCLATWKEGNARYLVGKVNHIHATSNEDRYRCFVYEKTSGIAGVEGTAGDGVEYRIAQSGDATCNGLSSATEGSRTLALRRAPTPARCRFPTWLTGALHWHSVNRTLSYSFHHRNASLRIIRPAGGPETRAHCSQINRQTATDTMIVVQYTEGCHSGFMCMHFYRRDTYIAEIQTGTASLRVEDACALKHFDPTVLPFVTILPSTPEPQPCPLNGRYMTHGTLPFPRSLRSPRGTIQHKPKNHKKVHEHHRLKFERKQLHNKTSSLRQRRDLPICSTESHELYIGCGFTNSMDFRPASECSTEFHSAYSCHGSWLENGTNYVVASTNHRGLSSHRVCFGYRDSGGTVKLIFGEICSRHELPNHLSVNITYLGQCSETSSSTSVMTQLSLTIVTLVTVLVHR